MGGGAVIIATFIISKLPRAIGLIYLVSLQVILILSFFALPALLYKLVKKRNWEEKLPRWLYTYINENYW